MTSIVLSRKMPDNAAELVMAFLRPPVTVFSDPESIVVKDVTLEHVRSKNGTARFRVLDVDLLSDPRMWTFYIEAGTPFQYGDEWCHLNVVVGRATKFRRKGHYFCTLELYKWQDRTEDVAPQYRCAIQRKQYVGRG